MKDCCSASIRHNMTYCLECGRFLNSKPSHKRLYLGMAIVCAVVFSAVLLFDHAFHLRGESPTSAGGSLSEPIAPGPSPTPVYDYPPFPAPVTTSQAPAKGSIDHIVGVLATTQPPGNATITRAIPEIPRADPLTEAGEIVKRNRLRAIRRSQRAYQP